jgi:hypothetical protein
LDLNAYKEKNCNLILSNNNTLLQFLNPITKKTFDLNLCFKEIDLKSRVKI